MSLIAFTRPSKRLADSIAFAESMGFEVMAAPSLEIIQGIDEDFYKTAELLKTGKVDYTIVGSATGVEECQRVFGNDLPEVLSNTTLISIGPNTTRVLKDAKVRVDGEPSDYSSYGLVELLEDRVDDKTVLLIRSNMGSQVLNEGLTRAGATVIELAAYRLEAAAASHEMDAIMDAIKDKKLDVMAFTSPMSASSFFAGMETRFGVKEAEKMMAETCVAAIGKPTALRLTELGKVPEIVPINTTFKDMLEAIKEALN